MKQFFKMTFASCLGVILASVLVFALFFAMLGSFVNSVTKGFRTEQKAQTKSVQEGSVLLLDLAGELKDTSGADSMRDLFMGGKEKRTYTLSEVLEAIETAKEDPSVAAISLRLDGLTAGYANAQELRAKLEDFKAVGKPIYAFTDVSVYSSYFINSVADKIYMDPAGMLAINGLGSTTFFMTGPLRKLGVQMQVFKVGKFKGAVEPYVLEKLSDENRAQISEYLNGLWEGTTGQIAEARGIDQSVLQSFADEGGALLPLSRALDANLVDSLVSFTEYDKIVARLVGASDKEEKPKYVRVQDLLGKKKNNKGEKIAVLFAEGAIVDVEESDDPFGTYFDQVITKETAKQLRELAEEDDVKAVVLRVNSPGGSVHASEQINREMKHLASLKPVVVSMGDYAASGGYYISAPATKIVAEPYTLTGSIGIFGMIPEASGLAKKIDLTYDQVKTARFNGLGNIFSPMTSEERELMQGFVERGYAQFLNRVSEGRGMSLEQVDSIAQGRVWLGAKALELGLVDQIGGLQEAIDEAARLAELETYRVWYRTDKKSLWEKILGFGITASAQSYIQNRLMSTPYEREMRAELLKLRQMTGVQALSPYLIDCESSLLPKR